MNIWNEICHKLQNCKNRDVLENVYEEKIVDCLALLNWSEADGEIKRQYQIQVGHEPKRADIVLSSNSIWQFVIEVKRPSHTIQEEDKKQLQSYMRQLKVRFGVYIGENIRLFYDDDSPIDIIKVLDIEINESDTNGYKFIELFQKDRFNLQRIEKFCVAEQQKQEEINKLVTDADGVLLKALLKRNYMNEGFPEEWAEEVLNNITIRITPTNHFPIINDVYHDKPIVNTKRIVTSQAKTKPKIHFFNKEYGIGSFALELVRLFVQEHHMTYNEYEKIFNTLPGLNIPNKMIRDIEEIRGTNKRFFTAPENLLHSIDNKTFVVNHEWTKERIIPVVDFAQRQGYDAKLIYPNKE